MQVSTSSRSSPDGAGGPREGIVGRGTSAGWSTCGPRPARLHDGPAPRRGRRAVRRRAGDGAEAGAVVPRDGRTSVATRGNRRRVMLPGPQGRRFTQREAGRWSRAGHIVLLCGRYEGMDERVASGLATDEVSIGDYVLSGGELRGDGDRRRGGPAGAGRRRRRAVGGRGFVRAAVARLPALHAPRASSGRTAGAGRAALGASRRDARGGGCGRRCKRTLERRPDLLEAAVSTRRTGPTPSGR